MTFICFLCSVPQGAKTETVNLDFWEVDDDIQLKKTVWSYCRQTAPSVLATLAGRPYMITLSFKVVAHSCRSLSSFEQNSRKYTSFDFFLLCLTMSTLSWLLLFDLCKKIVNGKILGRDFFSLYFSINRIFITTQKASGFQLIDIFSI